MSVVCSSIDVFLNHLYVCVCVDVFILCAWSVGQSRRVARRAVAMRLFHAREFFQGIMVRVSRRRRRGGGGGGGGRGGGVRGMVRW